jgi:hypothetical protein
VKNDTHVEYLVLHLEGAVGFVIGEGRGAGEQNVQDDPQGPAVNLTLAKSSNQDALGRCYRIAVTKQTLSVILYLACTNEYDTYLQSTYPIHTYNKNAENKLDALTLWLDQQTTQAVYEVSDDAQ